MSVMLLHELVEPCWHCESLERTGECCKGIDCACRNLYREHKRGELAQSIMVDYFTRKRKGRE